MKTYWYTHLLYHPYAFILHGRGQQQTSHRLLFRWCLVGTKGPKVQEQNIPHTISPPRVRMDSCFHDVWCQFWPSECQTRQHFSNLLSNLCLWKLWPQFLFLADRSSTQCGFLLLQPVCFKILCCTFRDGVLRTLVVTNGYLSYCYLVAAGGETDCVG